MVSSSLKLLEKYEDGRSGVNNKEVKAWNHAEVNSVGTIMLRVYVYTNKMQDPIDTRKFENHRHSK